MALADEWLRLALQSAKAVAWDWDIKTGSLGLLRRPRTDVRNHVGDDEGHH